MYQDTRQIHYGLLSAILHYGAWRTKTFIVGDPNKALYASLAGYAVPAADYRAEAGVLITEMALTSPSLKAVSLYATQFRINTYLSTYSC